MSEPADIFVSYAREDEDRAGRLVRALEACGWRVFWDRTIPPGETWRSHIGVPLDQATVVVVLWSHHSIDADFVHSEANRAKSRGALVPILLDDVAPPLGFEHIHAADLTRWIVGPPASLPDLLVRTLERRLAQPARVAPAPSAPPAPVTAPRPVRAEPPQPAAVPGRGLRWPVAASAVAVALLVGAGVGILAGGRSGSTEVTSLREQNRRLEDQMRAEASARQKADGVAKAANARIADEEKELLALRAAQRDAQERIKAATARADAADAALREAQVALRVATERLAALENARNPSAPIVIPTPADAPRPQRTVCVMSGSKRECEWNHPESVLCSCRGESGSGIVVEK